MDIKTVKSGITVLIKDHADLERRSGTVFKPENTGGGKIHTEVGKLCGCFYKGRIRIDERQDHGRAVAAEIIKCSAAKLLMETEIFLIALRHKGGIDKVHIADDAGLDVLLQVVDVGTVEICVSLHQDHAVLFCRVEHELRFVGIQRKWLLAKNVLPLLQRFGHPLHMDVIRKRDIDGLHFRVIKKLVVTAVGFLEAVVFLILFRLLEGSSRNGIELAGWRLFHAGDHAPSGDICGSNNSPFHLIHRKISYNCFR